jgi:hypothetical protein
MSLQVNVRRLIPVLMALVLAVGFDAAPASAQAPPGTEGAGKPRSARTVKPAKRRPGKPKTDPRKDRQNWPVKRPETPRHPLQVPAMGTIPFPQGERLQYKVNMLGIDAGEVMLGVGNRSKLGSVPVVPLVGWVRSSAALAKFYPIHDRLEVLVDERTFLPVRVDFKIDEQGNRVEYETVYNQAGKFILTTRKRSGEKDLVRNFTPAREVFDAMSSIYAARRMNLTPGLAFSYYVWDGRRERLISVKVVGQEKVWTEVGWFDTMRVDLVARVTGGFIDKKDLDGAEQKGSAWIGLDPQRTPVKVLTPTRLGDATGVLVRRFIEGQPSPPSAPAAPSAPATPTAPAAVPTTP